MMDHGTVLAFVLIMFFFGIISGTYLCHALMGVGVC